MRAREMADEMLGLIIVVIYIVYRCIITVAIITLQCTSALTVSVYSAYLRAHCHQRQKRGPDFLYITNEFNMILYLCNSTRKRNYSKT